MWDRGIVSSVGTNYNAIIFEEMKLLRENSLERIKFKKRWKKWESRERIKSLARSQSWIEFDVGR
ncbi:MAG TPA: hypothetical protein DF712_21375 [Balneola sp.]|nr:hypothetical protein [Balneola sp.]|tara:strand:- start:246 stop:440 length:195 start_codon:yes stop_codon:yes gene_type:complete